MLTPSEAAAKRRARDGKMDKAALHALVSSLYFVSSALHILFITGRRRWVRPVGFSIGIAGFAAHSVSIAVLFYSGGPLAGGVAKSLFLFAWFAVIAFLSVESKSRKSALGAFVFSLAFAATMPSLVPFAGSVANDPAVSEPLIQVHIALIFLGQAFFLVAFVSAVLYLVKERRIKKGALSESGDNFMPITGLDRIQHISLLYGFPLATLGLALGFFSASRIWGADWSWGGKETLSVATWLIYAVLINGRFAHGWKGRKSSIGAIAGFIAVAAVFFASYFLIPGRHTFG